MTNQLNEPSPNSVKVKLLSYLTQELLTPLTSVLGMTSVLSQEIYGPLTKKQKEYLEIINDSSRHLRSLVDEILALAELDESSQTSRTAVDVETLCQQVVSNLIPVAAKREQELNLSLGPANIGERSQGERIWLLDKDKVQQMLHQLLISIIQSADAGSVIRVHLSRREEELNLAVWLSHPWLGDSLPHAKLYSPLLSAIATHSVASQMGGSESLNLLVQQQDLPFSTSVSGQNRLALSSTDFASLLSESEAGQAASGYGTRERLGLLLCCQLLECQGGSFSIQGSPEAGYRYVLMLPGAEFASP